MTNLQLTVILVICTLILHTNAQVTFSKDWNAGKRSSQPQNQQLDETECVAPLKPTVALCQMFLNELRQIASCEAKSLLRRINEDNEVPPIYPQGIFMDTRNRRR